MHPGGSFALRRGIEDKLVTLGVSQIAAVNLRIMDPSEPPGSGFGARLAALVRARDDGLIGGIGLSNVSTSGFRRKATGCSPVASGRPAARPPGCWCRRALDGRHDDETLAGGPGKGAHGAGWISRTRWRGSSRS